MSHSVLAHPPALDPSKPVWIFAYGSLLWRPDFPYAERVPGVVEGYARRFWQASTDHRGTPERPGRVVTLVEHQGEACAGVCYRVKDSARERVLEELAVREKGGYSVEQLRFTSNDRKRTLLALSYVGHAGNPNFVGEQPLLDIAAIVRDACGPSGHNVAYVLSLAEALMEMGAEDAHVFELANLICDPDLVTSDVVP